MIRSVGVFDSGLGGLTVVKELIRLMPGLDIYYFGDTGRVPYGTRGVQTIRKYAKQDIHFLENFQVDLLIAACGTVSTVCLEDLYDFSKVPLIGVVKPSCQKACAVTQNMKIGVIGTNASIRSRKYEETLKSILPGAKVFSEACPLFVPLVENGYFGKTNRVARLVAEEYLASFQKEKVDTLIMGCTHYPLLEDLIAEIMGPKITLINPGYEIVARLTAGDWGAYQTGEPGLRRFFVSDETEGFRELCGIFLQAPMTGTVEKVDIEEYEQR